MVKMLGAVLLLLGAAGFSFGLCREQRKRIELLQEMKYLYQLLQEEIRYAGLPFPEIFCRVSEKLKEPFGSALRVIGEGLTRETKGSLSDIWQKEIKTALLRTPLSKSEKELLFRLPESAGMEERQGQANALERYVEELDRWIKQAEEEEKNKNKVIMSLGIAGGVFLVIWLL